MSPDTAGRYAESMRVGFLSASLFYLEPTAQAHALCHLLAAMAIEESWQADTSTGYSLVSAHLRYSRVLVASCLLHLAALLRTVVYTCRVPGHVTAFAWSYTCAEYPAV